jgi:predicted DNA-binding transcriptional regulator AlpA
MRSNELEDRGSREALWDANDVATYLKASRSWVYQKAEAGLLPCRRLYGLLRFDPEAIRAWARGDADTTTRVVPLHQPKER